jgi:hypothetical protein
MSYNVPQEEFMLETMISLYSILQLFLDTYMCSWLHVLNSISEVIFYISNNKMSQDSSVCIVTGYGLDSPGLIPGTARVFSSPQCPDWLPGSFPRGKVAGVQS